MMISSSDLAVGRELWNKLLGEGGYCWDHRREGMQTISVHVNRGKSLSKGLRAELSRDGELLKAFVFDMHDRQAAECARTDAAMGEADETEGPRC